MNFLGILIHIHSILRWVLLIFLLATIITAVLRRFGVNRAKLHHVCFSAEYHDNGSFSTAHRNSSLFH